MDALEQLQIVVIRAVVMVVVVETAWVVVLELQLAASK